MNIYYGKVDKINHEYGFLEEGDTRIDNSFIKLTEEEWDSLLYEQEQGKEIVLFNGEVFTAEVGRYYIDENGIWQKRNDAEFQNIEIEKLKTQKLAELNFALNDKQTNTEATVTLNLPVMLKKGDETKQVQSFKLLTVTSAGALATILTGYVVLASSIDISDLLVTADGYTIVGINNLVNGTKLINLIFAAYSTATAAITEYYRTTKDAILNAKSIKELEAIQIDLDQF